jgi:hypothetical protein
MLCAGCGNNPYLNDDEGAAQPSVPALGEHPDHLSLPYAAGAQIGMSAPKSEADWQLRSDTPTVFSVGKLSFDKSSGTLNADCTAGVPGQARLTLVDGSGAEQRAATIVVKAPDGAKLIAHGPARLLGGPGADPLAAEITEARVVTGATGVVAVAYFSGVERLFGRGIAQLSQPVGLGAEDHTTNGLPVNEFLFLKPATDGTWMLDVGAGGQHLATLPVTAVPATQIVGLTLEEETGGSRNDGDQVWVLAQARDGAGNRIYGAYSTWTLGGAPQLAGDMKTTAGDLFRYKIAPGGPSSNLVATFDGIQATLSIQPHSGQVYDTTYLGCSLVPGRPAASGPALALVAAAALLLALRRRRGATIA